MLVDILSRRCDETSFTAVCQTMGEVGQQRIVDKYFTSKDAESPQASGRPYMILCSLLYVTYFTNQ